MPNKFLVIDGCNGVGKSTITGYLSVRVGASSFHYPPKFVSFRRDVHLDELAPRPRLVYYLAATLHLLDLLRAQLTQSHVICDRYLASPLSLMIAESTIKETDARHLIEKLSPHSHCNKLLNSDPAKTLEELLSRSYRNPSRPHNIPTSFTSRISLA